MKKVMVIGCPGAGKSTFARKLQELTGLPLYYLDMIWHKPDRTNISREEFDRRIREIVSQDAWIIDGNYNRTLELGCGNVTPCFFWIIRWRSAWKGNFPHRKGTSGHPLEGRRI